MSGEPQKGEGPDSSRIEIPRGFLFFSLFPACKELLDNKMDRAGHHCGAGHTDSDPNRNDGIAGERGGHYAQDMVPGFGSCMMTVLRQSIALESPSSTDIKLSSCSMERTRS